MAVWLILIGTMLAVQLFVYIISKVEERLISKRLSYWSKYYNGAWYVFGTLLGESITRGQNSERAWAMR